MIQISKPSTVYVKPPKKNNTLPNKPKTWKVTIYNKRKRKKGQAHLSQTGKKTGLPKLASTNRCFLIPRNSCKLPTSKRCCCPCCRISSTSKRAKNINCWNLLWRIGAMRGCGRSFLMTGNPELNKPWHWPLAIIHLQISRWFLLSINNLLHGSLSKTWWNPLSCRRCCTAGVLSAWWDWLG